ncbi:MAG: flagellar hook-length control protein FliK [Candidatus Zixiibacteriota bacterium]|nr:MAG: flagellar hook-length control protein FliK [candidate division Zixibacteria bacterium]
MTQTPLNIFDLLMGDLTGFGAPVAGQASPSGQTPGLFGDIINSLLAPRNQVAISESIETREAFNLADLLNGRKLATGQESAAEFNRQLLSILPRQMGVIGANVKEAITNESIELKPGKYEILSSRVQDGLVNLEIVANENPDQTIRLTLPTEILVGVSGRLESKVPLTGDYYRSQYLDALLSKLNLKEIEIKPPEVRQPIEISAEPVKIAVVAEGSAGELVIRGKLERSQMRVSLVDAKITQQRSDLAERTIPTGEFDANYQHHQLLDGNARGRTQIGARMLTAGGNFLEKFINTDGEKQFGENKQILDTLFNHDFSTVRGEGFSEKIDTRAVRFTLPDNLSTALKASGRSVMIRIEPEHLGPARLSLTMTDDGLKARIVVDSVPAKVALESNLDRLVNQLADADVKVDHIEILINGDSTHNQFLGRRPHWRHRVISRLGNEDGASLDETDTPIIPPAAKAVGYAGPAGVNLLA